MSLNQRMGDHFNDPVVNSSVIIVKEKSHMSLCHPDHSIKYLVHNYNYYCYYL